MIGQVDSHVFEIIFGLKQSNSFIFPPEQFSSSSKHFNSNIANVRMNLRAQLNSIDVVNEDGSVENLGEKYSNKKNS